LVVDADAEEKEGLRARLLEKEAAFLQSQFEKEALEKELAQLRTEKPWKASI